MRKANVQKGSDLLESYNTDPTSFVVTSNYPTFSPEYGHNFPIFRSSLVPTMRRDPRIRYGLNLLKGPIQSFTAFVDSTEAENPQLHETIREQGVQFVYGVECEDQKVKEFILESFNQLWQDGLQEMLLAIDWGFSVCQVMYEKALDGKIKYRSMKHIHPFNTAPVMKNDKLIGAKIRGVPGFVEGQPLLIPKIIWHVHEKAAHPLHGESRLSWAFVPWHETWVCYGARDIRRTWFHRNSYNGGKMRYPIGSTQGPGGSKMDNKEIAVGMMANMRTGGFMVMPNEFAADGKTQKWDHEEPSSNVTPQGLMDYPEVLRLEMLEAMGIPPEVVESSSDGGLGSSTGRKVPLMVYYSSLSPLVNNVINDFKRFVLDYLIYLNFRKRVEYKISRVIPLKAVEAQLPGQDPNGESSPPGKGKPTVDKPKPKSPKKTDPITKMDKPNLGV